MIHFHCGSIYSCILYAYVFAGTGTVNDKGPTFGLRKDHIRQGCVFDNLIYYLDTNIHNNRLSRMRAD